MAALTGDDQFTNYKLRIVGRNTVERCLMSRPARKVCVALMTYNHAKFFRGDHVSNRLRGLTFFRVTTRESGATSELSLDQSIRCQAKKFWHFRANSCTI